MRSSTCYGTIRYVGDWSQPGKGREPVEKTYFKPRPGGPSRDLAMLSSKVPVLCRVEHLVMGRPAKLIVGTFAYHFVYGGT
jgi:hypothetical protein